MVWQDMPENMDENRKRKRYFVRLFAAVADQYVWGERMHGFCCPLLLHHAHGKGLSIIAA
jgi:hypothetical protein